MTMQQPDDPALSEAIDECVDALRRGESIDDCLSRYPDLADELRPLLLTALAAAGVSPERDDAARRVGRFRFEGAVQHHLAARERASDRWSLSGLWNRRTSRWSQAWAAGLATMALAVILSTGAAYASTDAMPDSPFYPVKRVTERARLAMTFSDGSRALYHLELIERRTLELAAVAESGDTDRVEQLSRDVLKNIEFARVEAGYTGEGAATAEDSLSTIEATRLTPASPVDPAIQQAAATTDVIEESTVSLRSLDARQLAYIEAERRTAAHAYAMLQIAHQLTPEHAREHILNALTLAEQRYRQTRLEGEPAPISRTLFAQGIVRINGGEMTLGGSLRFELSRNALGNRPPTDGDFATVGGYVRADGVLLVLRLFAFEAEGVVEDQIWLQAQTLGRNDERIFIPGFNVTPTDLAQVAQLANERGHWIYVQGTVTETAEVTGVDVHLLGDGPILFPRP